ANSIISVTFCRECCVIIAILRSETPSSCNSKILRYGYIKNLLYTQCHASVHIKYTGGIQFSGTLSRNEWYNPPQRLVKRIAKVVHFQCNNQSKYLFSVLYVIAFIDFKYRFTFINNVVK